MEFKYVLKKGYPLEAKNALILECANFLSQTS